NSKQTKSHRPGVMPLQPAQASTAKRTNEPQHLANSTPTKNRRDTAIRTFRLNSLTADTPAGPAVRSQEPSSLRRVRSIATMTPSPSPRSSRAANPAVPLIGPVPAARRVSIKQTPIDPPGAVQKSIQDKQGSDPHPPSTPADPRQSSTRYRTPSISQSRIPRPVSRAGSIAGSMRAPSPSVPTTSRTSNREPRQLPTPTSTVRVRERASSQASRPVPTASVNRARSRAGSSPQERPVFAKDTRLSRPSSRIHLPAGTNDVGQHRSRRPDSITSIPAPLDRREATIGDCATRVAA
ncbi:hypothetical protein FRC07_010142, partial [Ceratobasidium sp. 392]